MTRFRSRRKAATLQTKLACYILQGNKWCPVHKLPVMKWEAKRASYRGVESQSPLVERNHVTKEKSLGSLAVADPPVVGRAWRSPPLSWRGGGKPKIANNKRWQGSLPDPLPCSEGSSPVSLAALDMVPLEEEQPTSKLVLATCILSFSGSSAPPSWAPRGT